LVHAHWALWVAGGLEQRLDVASEIVELAEQIGERVMVMERHAFRVSVPPAAGTAPCGHRGFGRGPSPRGGAAPAVLSMGRDGDTRAARNERGAADGGGVARATVPRGGAGGAEGKGGAGLRRPDDAPDARTGADPGCGALGRGIRCNLSGDPAPASLRSTSYPRRRCASGRGPGRIRETGARGLPRATAQLHLALHRA